MLLIDDREPESVIVGLIRHPNWQDQRILVERLPAADFVFAYANKGEWVRQVGFESKTWSDLATSMRRNTRKGEESRFMQQILKIQATYPVAGLLLKGELETDASGPFSWLERKAVFGGKHPSGWRVKDLLGMTLTLEDRGVKVVQTTDGQLGYYLRWLHDHYARHQTDTDHFARGSEVCIAALDVIPGVTSAKARQILEGLGGDGASLRPVIAASVDALERFVPRRVAEEIWRRFH